MLAALFAMPLHASPVARPAPQPEVRNRGASQTISLELEELGTDQGGLVSSAQRLAREIPRPETIAKLPADLAGVPQFFHIVVGCEAYLLIADVAGEPGLYVCREGDTDTSGALRIAGWQVLPKAAPGKQPEPYARFGPVTFDRDDGPSTRVFVEVNGIVLRVYPAEYRAGKLKLYGRTLAVALVDRGLNGRYDDFCLPPLTAEDVEDWDGLSLDLNNNGRFERVKTGPWELQPLTPHMVLDNRRYRVQVGLDGSSLTLEETGLNTGTLKVPRQTILLLLGESGFMRVGPAVTWQLPAGKYVAWEVATKAIDAAGAEWLLESVTAPGTLKFEVPPGGTVSLPLGTALKEGGSAPAGEAVAEEPPVADGDRKTVSDAGSGGTSGSSAGSGGASASASSSAGGASRGPGRMLYTGAVLEDQTGLRYAVAAKGQPSKYTETVRRPVKRRLHYG